jgi:hypothetical protein
VPSVQTSDREFVVEIARAIVAPVDPGSVRYVAADAESYFADPRRALARRGPQTPLGSGLEIAVTGLTVAAVYIAEKSLDVYLEATIRKGAGRVRSLMDRARRRPPALPDDAPTFSDEQIERISQAVTGVAKGRGLDPAAAAGLAAAVRERLPRDPGPSAEG